MAVASFERQTCMVTGIGMSKADQGRIFQPFVQVGDPSTQKGSGLGLAIARGYADLMGGSVNVVSEVGKGSMFRVDLPVKISNENIKLKPSRGRVVGIGSGQPEFRILIVEDQLENQILLRSLLESVGFKVKLAENGEESVDLFKSFKPHFIWMDRRMPKLDGLKATKLIRKLPGGKDVKIVGISASVLDNQRLEMLAEGMDDFVRKPYKSSEIYECMEKNLGVRFVYKPLKKSLPAN